MTAADMAIAQRRREVASAPMASFRGDVLAGLARARKRLPCKYFYDRRGSELFEQICQLPEYYLTRTEISILRQYAAEMAQHIGRHCLLIEPGSGSSSKTQILLDHLIDPGAYVPMDISPAALVQAARELTGRYPRLPVLPVCADYTRGLELPSDLNDARRRVVFFPGSTIGNFEPREARAFLGRLRNLCRRGGLLLIGVDLKKDPAVLHAAYNDSAGVTAAFNVNLLERINRELAGDLDVGGFDHYAFYNPRRGRVEMHLVSGRAQTACVAGRQFAFDPGESIHTENSYKYAPEEFVTLADDAGFRREQQWADARQWFGVSMFRAV